MSTDLKPVEPYNDNTIDHRWVKFDEECSRKEKQRSFRKTAIMVSSALIIGIFGCFGYIHFYNSSKVGNIFNKYYERYDVASTFNSNHVKAISNYYKGNSKEAIRLFNSVPKADSLNITCNFYMALSYIDCNKLKEAVDLLTPIAQHDNIYYHPANWYIGLSYLKIHKITEAKTVFIKVVESDSPYKEKAFEILGLLEEFNE